jgi:hypothetical protein
LLSAQWLRDWQERLRALSDSPAKAPPAAALLGGLLDTTMRTAPQYLPISTESPRQSAALVSHRRKRQVAVFLGSMPLLLALRIRCRLVAVMPLRFFERRSPKGWRLAALNIQKVSIEHFRRLRSSFVSFCEIASSLQLPSRGVISRKSKRAEDQPWCHRSVPTASMPCAQSGFGIRIELMLPP